MKIYLHLNINILSQIYFYKCLGQVLTEFSSSNGIVSFSSFSSSSFSYIKNHLIKIPVEYHLSAADHLEASV